MSPLTSFSKAPESATTQHPRYRGVSKSYRKQLAFERRRATFRKGRLVHLSSPFGSRARFRDAAAAPRYANALGDLDSCCEAGILEIPGNSNCCAVRINIFRNTRKARSRSAELLAAFRKHPKAASPCKDNFGSTRKATAPHQRSFQHIRKARDLGRGFPKATERTPPRDRKMRKVSERQAENRKSIKNARRPAKLCLVPESTPRLSESAPTWASSCDFSKVRGT